MWTFLNPALLWAAAAAVVPLLLHLFQRRRALRIPFSTLRFLKLAQKRSARRVRVENFLLWALRTLLVLCLALAFALPVLRMQGLGGLMGRTHRDLALVLDVSYSMGYESAQRSTWEAARAAAISLVEGLQKGDRVCVFLADDDVTPLVEQPVADLELVLRMLRAQRFRTTPSQLAPATLAAIAALEKSSRRERELHIITDGQALPWRSFRREEGTGAAPEAGTAGTIWGAGRPGRDIAVFVTLVGPPEPRNSFPASVAIEPLVLMAETPGTLSLRVGHTGPPQSLAATLLIDGREITSVTLEARPDEVAELQLGIPPLKTGVHSAQVKLPPDGLSVDDTLHFLLRVRESLPVLCVGTAEETFFLARALNPGGRAPGMVTVRRLESTAVAAEPLTGYATVFLCDALPLAGQAVLALEDYVRRGGTLVIFPGDRASPVDYEPWRCLPARPVGLVNVPEQARLRTLRLTARRDPVSAGLTLPPGAAPTLAVQREIVWTNAAPDATMVVAAGESVPFLWARPYGNGRVFCFSVAANRAWSTLPLSPMFLPLVHQIVRAGAGIGRLPLYHTAARTMALSDLIPGLNESARLTGPDGRVLPVHVSREAERTVLYAEDVYEPGIYSLSFEGSTEPLLAVNVDRQESDLRVVAARELPGLMGSPDVVVAQDRDELLRRLDEHRRGRPLTEPLLWLALVLAVAEVWLANRMSRRLAVPAVAAQPAGGSA